MPTLSKDSSRQNHQQEWLADLFAGLQKSGFTGLIKIHMHAGGIRGARREENIDLDWRAS